jgi:hypothetical protein
MAMRVIRASAGDIRRAWCDSEMTLPQAAASVGMSSDALQDRAAALGLPHRRTGRREVIRPHQEADFSRMWAAGIAAREIGEYFGCSYFAVVNTATRLGLPMRGAGFRPPLNLADWREIEMARAMKDFAERENRALKGLAE